MKNFFYIVIYFNCTIIFGQTNIDSVSRKFINELRIKKIDTVAIYQEYSTGGVQIVYTKKGDDIDHCKNSKVPKTIYFFWKKNNKTFCTKKDECFDYVSTELKDENLWEIFYKNLVVIKSEKPKNFQTGPDEFMMIDHSTYRDFKFIIQNEIIRQAFDLYDFLKQEEYRENPQKNLSYEFNQNLKSKVVMDLLENLSKKYDSKIAVEQKKRRI